MIYEKSRIVLTMRLFLGYSISDKKEPRPPPATTATPNKIPYLILKNLPVRLFFPSGKTAK